MISLSGPSSQGQFYSYLAEDLFVSLEDSIWLTSQPKLRKKGCRNPDCKLKLASQRKNLTQILADLYLRCIKLRPTIFGKDGQTCSIWKLCAIHRTSAALLCYCYSILLTIVFPLLRIIYAKFCGHSSARRLHLTWE